MKNPIKSSENIKTRLNIPQSLNVTHLLHFTRNKTVNHRLPSPAQRVLLNRGCLG